MPMKILRKQSKSPKENSKASTSTSKISSPKSNTKVKSLLEKRPRRSSSPTDDPRYNAFYTPHLQSHSNNTSPSSHKKKRIVIDTPSITKASTSTLAVEISDDEILNDQEDDHTESCDSSSVNDSYEEHSATASIYSGSTTSSSNDPKQRLNYEKDVSNIITSVLRSNCSFMFTSIMDNPIPFYTILKEVSKTFIFIFWFFIQMI